MDLELDDWLARESVALGISKSALVRECVRRKASAPVPDNGLWLLPIFDDVEPVEDIDAEIYGPFEADA